MPDMTPQIKHVVLLILENHSFDQMLGAFKAVYTDLEGIDPTVPGVNFDRAGTAFHQVETRERQMFLDPRHEVEHVATQLQATNGGFVRDFEENFKQATDQEKQFIMGYYPLDFLPALHALAREFTICDHWFSSLPGPTWPNRFFALTGTSNGKVNMPQDDKHGLDIRGWFEQDQATIFDRLNEKGIHWKVYFHDIPQTCVLMHQRRLENVARYYYIQQFFQDAAALAADFPAFCLIEPDYMGSQENDDHPPHDIMKAQRLLADIYNALRANEDLWNSTLFVVYYDEHGGFYDHLVPPLAKPPGIYPNPEYTFDQLGVRVPALLVSPWVGKRLEQMEFDHTSLLKYLIKKWDLGPLGDRVAAANSVEAALTVNGSPRQGTLQRIALNAQQMNPPDADLEEKAEQLMTDHHKALALVVRYIKIAAVENFPRWYTFLARLVEWMRDNFTRLLEWAYKENHSIQVLTTRPDRVSRDKTVDLREDVAAFIRHQKKRAMTVLAGKIRRSADETEREHAMRALGSMTGRHFHREQDGLRKADRWLKDRGH